MNVSAKTKQGIDKLLEMLALQAEVLELKANPNKAAKGTRGRGAARPRARPDLDHPGRGRDAAASATLVVAGEFSGKIRAMLGDKGQTLTEAGPSTPVEVLGLDGVPDAGEVFNVVDDEKAAKSLVEHRHDARRKKELAGTRAACRWRTSSTRSRTGEVKEVKIVLKADVQGSVEAVANALTQAVDGRGGRQRHLDRRRRHHRVRRQPGQGVVGHRHRLQRPSRRQGPADGRAGGRRHQAVPGHLRRHRRREEGHGRHAGADLAREAHGQGRGAAGLHHPEGRHHRAARFVTEGKVTRKAQLRLVRDSVVIYTGKVGSLRRFKDDVIARSRRATSAASRIEGYGDSRKGDIIEAFEIEIDRPDARKAPTESRRRPALAAPP